MASSCRDRELGNMAVNTVCISTQDRHRLMSYNSCPLTSDLQLCLLVEWTEHQKKLSDDLADVVSIILYLCHSSHLDVNNYNLLCCKTVMLVSETVN